MFVYTTAYTAVSSRLNQSDDSSATHMHKAIHGNREDSAYWGRWQNPEVEVVVPSELMAWMKQIGRIK